MKKLDTPLLPALAVSLLAAIVLLAQLNAHHGDVTYFINVGDKRIAEPENVPAGLYIFPNSLGYDGVFYYEMALHPWLNVINSGLWIGNPPYREQRQAYPVIVRMLSLGVTDFVPGVMLAVNFIALVALGWLGGRFAQARGAHALAGAVFALYPGFLISLTRDTTEILSAVFILAAILALDSRPWLAAVCLGLALFTRETALIAVAALGVVLVARREWRRLWIICLPLILFSAWQGVLWAKWGVLPMISGDRNIGVPLVGVVGFLGGLHLGNGVEGVWLAQVVFLVAVGVLAAFGLRRAPRWMALAWVGYVVLALVLTRHVWSEDIAYLRTLFEFYLLSVATVFYGRRDLLSPVVSLTGLVWVLTAFVRLDW